MLLNKGVKTEFPLVNPDRLKSRGVFRVSSSPPCRRPSPQSNSQLRPRLASRGRRTASTGTSTHGATTRSRGWQRSGLGASGCLPPATRRDDCDGRPPRATTRRSWPPQRRRQREASTCDHRPGTFKRGLCGRPLHAQKAASRLRQLGGDARASSSDVGEPQLTLAAEHARHRLSAIVRGPNEQHSLEVDEVHPPRAPTARAPLHSSLLTPSHVGLLQLPAGGWRARIRGATSRSEAAATHREP